jgi:hypothetical protein
MTYACSVVDDGCRCGFLVEPRGCGADRWEYVRWEHVRWFVERHNRCPEHIWRGLGRNERWHVRWGRVWHFGRNERWHDIGRDDVRQRDCREHVQWNVWWCGERHDLWRSRH